MTTGSGAFRRLRLRPLRDDDEDEVRRAQAIMSWEGFEFALGLAAYDTWAGYLQHLADEQAGRGLEPGRVPGTLLVAEVDGRIVGRASVRHRLNDWLLEHAGHIGYGVLPAFRRNGFATAILRESLVVARAVGVERVLVVCDADNVGSRKTIERCGGTLAGPRSRGTDAAPGLRYWID